MLEYIDPSDRNYSGKLTPTSHYTSELPQLEEASHQNSLDEENVRMHELWDFYMDDKGGRGLSNRRTYVLLLSWHPDLDGPGVDEDILRLGSIFEDVYNYTVLWRLIGSNLKKSAQSQVRKILTDFVYEYDNENTLLIVYYGGGHGDPGEKPGHLVLKPYILQSQLVEKSTNHDERKKIFWHETEDCISDTQGDVCVIFDCSYAGNLVHCDRKSIERNFHFLGSTDHKSLTAIPGESSFTAALIWALKELAKNGAPFTLHDLQFKIKFEAPDFPRTQEPVVSARSFGKIAKQLVLAVDPKEDESNEVAPLSELRTAPIKEVIDLRLHFTKHPEDVEIQSLTELFKTWIDEKRSATQRVQWVQLRQVGQIRESRIGSHWKKVSNYIAEPRPKLSLEAPNTDNPGGLNSSDLEDRLILDLDRLCNKPIPDLGVKPPDRPSPIREEIPVTILPANNPSSNRRNMNAETRLLYHIYGLLREIRYLLRLPELSWALVLIIFTVALLLYHHHPVQGFTGETGYFPRYKDFRLIPGAIIFGICFALLGELLANIFRALKVRISFPAIPAFLRPRIGFGKTRIEWRCACGKQLYDDFSENLPGAAETLKQYIDHGGSKIRASPQSNISLRDIPNENEISNVAQSSNPDSPTPNILTPSSQEVPNVSSHEHIHHEQQSTSGEDLFLLICYNTTFFSIRLEQLKITNITSDKLLFDSIRHVYQVLRGFWRPRFSLRTLTGIKFVRFAYYNEFVDIRKTDDVPPPENQEYKYLPRPLELIPPIGDRYLMHQFQCSQGVNYTSSSLCLSRFPKKINSKVECKDGDIILAWGLQFVEGWDLKRIWIVLFVIFVGGSILIGVLWSVYGHSVQTAFAVAGYIISLTTVAIGFTQALLVM